MQNIYLLIFVIILTSCGEPKLEGTPQNAPIPEQRPQASPEGLDNLAEALDADKLDDFYQGVKKENIQAVRQYFEDSAKKGASYNYGVLVNADIVTAANKSLFKPDIKKIDHFRTVPNESHCYMNSALYDIANSAFFDDFLEMDKIFSKEWIARNKDNLKVADPILRTMREVIYEIRRGENTTPERIAKMRARHIDTFLHLNDAEIVTNIYSELLSSYDFGKIESFFIDDAGKKRNGFIKIKTLQELDVIDLNAVIKKYNLYPEASEIPYGHLGLVSCGLHGLGGGHDLWYLNAIFPIIDPWGKTARYMAAALFGKGIGEKEVSINSIDPWHDKELLVFNVKAPEFKDSKIRLVHNDLVLHGNMIVSVISYHFRAPFSQKLIGVIAGKGVYWDPNFYLIAKSRGSFEGSKGIHRHEIAELYRYARNEWETQEFFGPPTFSASVSSDADGRYKDYLYYFERKAGN